jgi:hypothetical protein
LAEPPRRLIWMLKLLGGASAALAIAALVAAQFVVLGARATDPVFGPFDNGSAWTDIISSFAQAAIVSLASAWLLEKASGGRESPEAMRWTSQFVPAAALVLCAVELTLANAWLVPTAPAELWRNSSAIAAAIGDSTDPSRLYRDAISWPAEFTTHGSPQRLQELIRWERDTLAGRYGLLDRIGQVNINESAGAADYESIRASLPESDRFKWSTHPSRDLERLSVHYVVLDEGYEQFAAEWVDGARMPRGALLWKLNAPDERLQMPDDANVNISTWTVWRTLAWHLADGMTLGRGPPVEITNVEGDLKLYDQPQVVQSGTPPTATIVAESPQHVAVRARLPWWNLVVLNDRYADGWKAKVTSSTAEKFSGRETTVYRTNSLFRGVYLPAGEHTIEFRYEPAAFYRGAWISGLSWAALLIGIGVLQWRRRHRK